MKYKITMLDGEYWWGGSSNDGTLAPYHKDMVLARDFRSAASNQTMPMYISNMGRCIWSESPFACEIKDGAFEVIGNGVCLETYGSTLRDAYIGAMNAHFKPCGDTLEKEFFRVPQYNTWMQLIYTQTQDGVLNYAREIVKNGFKPGILMIDEGWQNDYGDWTFDLLKFPNPKGMVDELHAMGFKVLLWVVPYVTPNGLRYYKNTSCHFTEDHHFLRTKDGSVAVIKWWNGNSAILDFTKECDRRFFDDQLQSLMREYGVDGFKFDGGRLLDYTAHAPINGEANDDFTAAERNIAWNEFGAKYRYHEYKDTFKGGGKRSIQRLRDKRHSWDNDGLNTLVPNAIAAGLLGHPFICPDMIGGGEWKDRAVYHCVDGELFVRMAQCSALFPMMQFSWAPWEAVEEERLSYIKRAHDLHNAFSEKILSMVDEAHETGEPILRALEYNYPNEGFARVTDQFMLGDSILVAPVLQKGQTEREVVLPKGSWLGYDGTVYEGGNTVRLSVTLADLPYFEKIKA